MVCDAFLRLAEPGVSWGVTPMNEYNGLLVVGVLMMLVGVGIWVMGYYNFCPPGANCGCSPGANCPDKSRNILDASVLTFFTGLAFAAVSLFGRRGSQRGARVPTPTQALGSLLWQSARRVCRFSTRCVVILLDYAAKYALTSPNCQLAMVSAGVDSCVPDIED